MKFLKDIKGQGAIEYLIIIGGAVLIAAIVIAVLAQTGSTAKDGIDKSKESLDTSRDQLEDLLD